ERAGKLRARVFADGLPFPNGVLPWQGGVVVTAAPHIWFFKDRDGEGRAGERRLVLPGFGEGNQQLRVNGLLWCLDNWGYGANGAGGGGGAGAGGPAGKGGLDPPPRLPLPPADRRNRAGRRLQSVRPGPRRRGPALPLVEHRADATRRARRTLSQPQPGP